jgi:hypothetical protein
MSRAPIDTSTGLQAGSQAHAERVPVLVGWLVTHDDGFEARLGPDRARAEVYVRQHRAQRIEGMFVWRELPTHPAPPIR